MAYTTVFLQRPLEVPWRFGQARSSVYSRVSVDAVGGCCGGLEVSGWQRLPALR